MITKKNKTEFGDFQTPTDLAREIVAFLQVNGQNPDVIVEPTCGRGNFIKAAIDAFPRAKAIYGFDINRQYICEAAHTICPHDELRLQLECLNFFHVDWTQLFSTTGGTILVLGNPPWVTNSVLGAMGSDNLPEKSNFQGRNGFASKTGKANFDISEWMLIRLAEALHHRVGCVAMLCKTSTARKTLRHVWLNRWNIGQCSLHSIDAQTHFAASVDACLLIMHTGIVEPVAKASVYRDLSFNHRESTLGLAGNELVADIDEYMRLKDIEGIPYYTWRSGVKHDAAGIMEFKKGNANFMNGRGETCSLETTYLYPLLKSSDIANGRLTPDRYVLVTQKKPADDTNQIEAVAPKTWAYLNEHAEALDQRRSIIYTKRARFSIFGVGDYTFSPWKVAVSGLYKNCHFEVIGRHRGKPTLLDDTCYFVPCASEEEARFICELLNSDVGQRFLRSIIFFDSKRPITIDVLNRIDFKRLADHLNRTEEARRFLLTAAEFEDNQPLLVFEKKTKYRAKKSSLPRKARGDAPRIQ